MVNCSFLFRSLSTSATSNSAGASNELLGCSATEAKLLEAMETVCSTVAKLIQWADRVIVDGKNKDLSASFAYHIFDPITYRFSPIETLNKLERIYMTHNKELFDSIFCIIFQVSSERLLAGSNFFLSPSRV